MSVGWGIIGTGWAATSLVGPSIRADPESQIKAVLSRDPERARKWASEFGAAAAYSDLADLLHDPAVDIVYIATPNALHASQVMAAVKAGKHVLCDKPLATSLDDAKEAVAAAREAGVLLGINFQARHYAAIREIKQLVDAGRIGNIELISVDAGAGHAPLAGWRTDRALAGLGTVNNMAVHLLDLVYFLVGEEAAEVQAMTNVSRPSGLETMALIQMKFKSGILAHVSANQEVPQPRRDLAVFGSKGSIVGSNATYFNLDSHIRVLDGTKERDIASTTSDGFKRSVAAFRQCVQTGQTPSASGEDGLKSVRLVAAIEQSIRTGQTVSVDSR